MLQRRGVLILALIPGVLLLALQGCEGDENQPGSIGFDGGGPQIDTGPPLPQADSAVSETSTDAADGGGEADATTCLVLLDGGAIEPVPYRQASDSPFHCVSFQYFHLETFEEGGVIKAPGLAALTGAATSSAFPADAVDSVDNDDGTLSDGGPGACVGCQSWIHTGSIGITFEFDELVLGSLPTHAGLVWTDGAENQTVTFQAFGADGGLLTSYSRSGIGDNNQLGTVEEDRFFGVVNPAGVKRIRISHPTAGIEVDHVQYGR